MLIDGPIDRYFLLLLIYFHLSNYCCDIYCDLGRMSAAIVSVLFMTLFVCFSYYLDNRKRTIDNPTFLSLLFAWNSNNLYL